MQVQHLVRASDPISSHLAAARSFLFSAKHSDRVLYVLKVRGQATAHEMQRETGLTVVQIDRRLPELLKAGKVRVVQRGGMDLMRGKARVWEAV